MKHYTVIIKRVSFETLEVFAEDRESAESAAKRGEGRRVFKADDKVEILGAKEILDKEEDHV